MSHYQGKTAGPICPKYCTPEIFLYIFFFVKPALDGMYFKFFVLNISFFGVEDSWDGIGWGREGRGF